MGKPIFIHFFVPRNQGERICDRVQQMLHNLAELNQIYDSHRHKLDAFKALELIEARQTIIEQLELP